MSLRSLGSLLTRRLSARGIPRVQAQAKTLGLGSAVGRPARSLHSLRDLAVGGGAYGGIAAASFAGFVGILYVMKGSDKLADEVSGEETKVGMNVEVATKDVAKKGFAAEEARKQGDMMEAAAKEDNGDDLYLEKYLAEMTELAAAQKKARYEREMSRKKAVKEKTSIVAVKEEDMKEEAAMKARFEDWMKEYGRRYKNEEEKARRYELFKAFAKMVDKANAQGGKAVFVTNHTADWTEEECRCLYDNDVDWDDYLDHIQSLIDKKNAKAKKGLRK